MRNLNPTLNAALDALNATAEEKAILVAFLENQATSAVGRVNGLTNSIDDLLRQKAALEADASRIVTMVDKFTIEAAPEPEPAPEPAP